MKYFTGKIETGALLIIIYKVRILGYVAYTWSFREGFKNCKETLLDGNTVLPNPWSLPM